MFEKLREHGIDVQDNMKVPVELRSGIVISAYSRKGSYDEMMLYVIKSGCKRFAFYQEAGNGIKRFAIW